MKPPRAAAPVAAPHKVNAGSLAGLRARLTQPAVLTTVAATLLLSAVAQTVAQALVHDRSIATIAVLSVLGSLFLAVAIAAAVGWNRHEPRGRG